MSNGTVPIKPAVAYFDFFKINSSGTTHVVMPGGPSLTRQEFAEECDINKLMARYEGHVIGGPGNLPPVEPLYVDWTQTPATLMEYMEFMREAENSFMSLPAVVRREFENNAVAFVDFASDPSNLGQMRDWGLAPPAKAPEAAPAPSAASGGGPAGGPSAASPAPSGTTQSLT